MTDFLLVHLHDPHSVLIRPNLTANGRGDHHLQGLVEAPSVPVVVTTEHFLHSSFDKLIQFFESEVFLNIEIEFPLVSILHKPGDVLEDDDMSHASLSGGLQLDLQPLLVLFVQLGDVGGVLIELGIEHQETTAVLVEGKVVITEGFRVGFYALLGWRITNIVVTTDTDHGNVLGQLGVDILQILLLSCSDLGKFVTESIHEISTDNKKCRLGAEIVYNFHTLTTELDLLVPLGVRVGDPVLPVGSVAVHQTQLSVCSLDEVEVGFPLGLSFSRKI